ncbi:MAG: hypothetical protein IPK00_25255 [Deltaproteobacteria bacterium]|nr:hypothetical protein [Deltaproteobacteria bacterium]
MKTDRPERGLFLVFSNATSGDEIPEFHWWYDDVHVHEVLRVPGVRAATRYELDPDQMQPGGADALGRRLLCAYEIEADDLARVRDALMATSTERSHSGSFQLDPMPILAIFRELGPRVANKEALEEER